MFTRNELLIIGFMALFALAGGVVRLAGRSSQAQVPVITQNISKAPLPEAGNNAAPAIDSARVRVNINTADRQALVRLPGIGPTTAEKIIEYRRRRGPFKNASDLLNIKGIGRKKLEKIIYYLEI